MGLDRGMDDIAGSLVTAATVAASQPPDAAWLILINCFGTALGHGAKSAAPRAEIAQHHEGRRLVVPAFADVGAVR